jgi:prepilin-type N-terminal cleavage/methylation domain-containing protein/prepilin-type processing-associated H-X9-DG protein
VFVRFVDTSKLGSTPMPRKSAVVLRAFTLIELLVVVSIIALLIAILLPSLHNAREQAKTVVCQTRFHSIALGAYTYATDFGRYPPTLASIRQIPDLASQGGVDWLGVGSHMYEDFYPVDCDNVPSGFPINDPTAGTPPGFCASPRFGKLWPYVKDEGAYVCSVDKRGLYNPGSLTGGGGNGKFSFVMFASMGFRSPEEGVPSRLSDPVSGGPRGGGLVQYRLSKRPLSKIPVFVPEHPEGIGLRIDGVGGGHCEGNFNFNTDRVVARHGPRRPRLGYRPGASTVSMFKQGTATVGYADGHVESLPINLGFKDIDIKPVTAGGRGYDGIPETAEGLLYYYGLVYQEVWGQPGGGLIYQEIPEP